MFSSETYQYLLHHVSDAILLESLDRKIIYVNQPFCDLFKISATPESLIGFDCKAASKMAAAMFKHPDDFLNTIESTILAQKHVKNEYIALENAGYFFLRDYIPIDKKEEEIAHLWIYKNRTIEYELLEQNNQQDAYYKTILNNIPADIAVFNPNHQYLFVNQNGIKNQEIREWIIGKDDFDYYRMKNLPIDDAQKRRAIFNTALESKNLTEFEDVSVKKDGSKTHNLRKFYPVTKLDGTVDYVVGYGINIDNIVEKQVLLEKSEKQFKNLLYHLNEAALIINKQKVIIFVNPIWESIFGYSVAETLGAPISQFVNPTHCNSLCELIQQLEQSNKTHLSESITISNKYKETKHLQITISINKATDSVAGEVMLFINDVTEQKKATDQFKRMIEKEKKLNEMKNSFITMVSHELRTPLAILQSTLDLIEMDIEHNNLNLAELSKEIVSMQEEILRSTKIMNQLLDISQNENAKIELKPTSIDVANFIGEVVRKTYTPWEDGRKIITQFKGNGNKKLVLDAFSTAKIVHNVVENAFKYSHNHQPVNMVVRTYPNSCSILVVDNGIGIPETDHKNLFASFKRGNNVGSIPGTGMGLVIAQYFLKNVKGSIRIKSTLNRGTAVYIQLPNLTA